MDNYQIEPDHTAEGYLAALLVKDADCREKIVDSLRLEMFLTELPHSVFAAICDLMVEDVAVDQVSLEDRLTKFIDNPAVVIQLVNDQVVLPDNVDHYIKRVWQNWRKSTIFNTCQEMQGKLTEDDGDFDKVIAEFEDKVLQSGDGKQQIQHIFTEAADLADQARKSGGLGYSWGLPKLDKYTRGIIPGCYYAIGGLKKTGKTLFGINTIAELVGSQKVPCLVFSLEMSATAIAWALLSRQTKIDSAQFGTRYLDDDQMARIHTAAITIETDWPLYIDSRKGLSVEQIIASIRRHVRKGVKVVLIDYLQRIDIPNRSDNRATAIQKAINKLADAAAKYDVALLILSQLANRAEFGNKPTVGDFKESGGITEACDCALLLDNIDRTEGNFKTADRTRKFDIIIALQRIGESGTNAHFRHDLKTAHFYEIEKNEETK